MKAIFEESDGTSSNANEVALNSANSLSVAAKRKKSVDLSETPKSSSSTNTLLKKRRIEKQDLDQKCSSEIATQTDEPADVSCA